MESRGELTTDVPARALLARWLKSFRAELVSKERTSMSYLVTGTVHLLEDTKTYGSGGFCKRLMVLEKSSNGFTNYVPLEFIKEDCDSANSLSPGDEVEVQFRLNGRKWQRDSDSDVRYFLNAEVVSFKVTSSEGEHQVAQSMSDEPNSSDDVPF